MEAAAVPHLRPVTDDDLLVNPKTGVPVDASYRIRELEDKLDGWKKTCDKQARAIGALERRLSQYDPDQTAQPSELNELFERWRKAANHPGSKPSKDRYDYMRARLKDGYSHTQLELAIDGIGAYPYVVNGQRVRDGKKTQRHDRLGIALGGGEEVEKFANLGHHARKAGWTVEGGWPQ